MSSSADRVAEPEAAHQKGHTSTEPSKGPSIKLKGSLAPMTALELEEFDPQSFEQELAAKVQQAPSFFENLPVLIGLEKFTGSSLDFDKLITICAIHTVKAVAVRGANQELQEQAKAAGLGILAKQKDRSPEAQAKTATEAIQEPANQEQTQEIESAPAVQIVTKTATQASKIVHHPVRSGQQVYAADGDLIVLASVSAGAEILADGNIHVYGTLRGRALAGVKGNTKARIFCHGMAAELVSIAGQYKVSEDIPSGELGKPCQVYLEEDALKFKKLDF